MKDQVDEEEGSLEEGWATNLPTNIVEQPKFGMQSSLPTLPKRQVKLMASMLMMMYWTCLL